MNILGLDPGADGGIAIITPGREDVTTVKFTDMTAVDVWRMLRLESLEPCRAFLEKVHGLPGCAGQFAFGQKFGWLEMALIGCGIPYEYVSPQRWMQGIGIASQGVEKKERKKRLKARAQELFPSLHITLKDADALLIAEYGYRVINKELR